MRSFCAFALFVLLSTSAAWTQTLTVDDLISARKFLSEDKLLNKFASERYQFSLGEKSWQRLQQEGFSPQFIARLQKLVEQSSSPSDQNTPENSSQPPSSHLCKIEVVVQPSNAGKVIFDPPLGENGKVAAGTVVRVLPRGNSPYLFDHWQGDVRGYGSLKLQVEDDTTLVAVFRQPHSPSTPPKIEDPEEFRDTRKAEHIYQGEVMGVVEGRGVNKDWGIAAEVDYKYLYHLHYSSDVVSNDGYHIQEKRTFHSVEEILVISKYSFRLDVSKDLQWVKDLTLTCAKGIYVTGQVLKIARPGMGSVISGAGRGLYLSTKLGEQLLARAEKIIVSQKQAQDILRRLEQVVGKQEWVENLKARLTNPRVGRILGYPPNMKLLQDKTFHLEYENGVGLVKVDIADPERIITAREKELIQRAFYLSDYYIFRNSENPQQKLQPGDTWQVDARTLAGVIDPRLRHRAQGKIHLQRRNNRDYQNKTVALFALKRGNVRMVPFTGRKKVKGEVSLTEGEILYDLDKHYVINAHLSGIANYREVSTDHLIFGARLTTQPRVTIRYQCQLQAK